MKRIIVLLLMLLLLSCSYTGQLFKPNASVRAEPEAFVQTVEPQPMDPDSLGFYILTFQLLHDGTLADSCPHIAPGMSGYFAWNAPTVKLPYDDQADQWAYPDSTYQSENYIIVVDNDNIYYDGAEEALAIIDLVNFPKGEYQLTVIAAFNENVFSKPSEGLGFFLDEPYAPGYPARLYLRVSY